VWQFNLSTVFICEVYCRRYVLLGSQRNRQKIYICTLPMPRKWGQGECFIWRLQAQGFVSYGTSSTPCIVASPEDDKANCARNTNFLLYAKSSNAKMQAKIGLLQSCEIHWHTQELGPRERAKRRPSYQTNHDKGPVIIFFVSTNQLAQ
jgi:hypothetical protein